MRIAVEGCCHGELDNIYKAIQEIELLEGVKVDLLLICGDFQSIRNKIDLDAMAVPERYKLLGIFYQYYNGDKVAPIPTIFIGGNHEASNYLQELFHGGYVCPNIYYLGAAGVVTFGGLRIAGMSGIYKSQHYDQGYFEEAPLTGGQIRSIYHVRKASAFKLSQLREPVDIFMSHDWPLGIAKYGDLSDLYQFKGFLKPEIENNTLGSPPAAELLHNLKPNYWFSAHLHVKYAAVVNHGTPKILNPDQIEMDLSSDDSDTESAKEVPKVTHFLSLDKCLPKRKFLQILDFQSFVGENMNIQLDPEWISIMRAAEPFMSYNRTIPILPSNLEIREKIDLERQSIDSRYISLFPPDFSKSAPGHGYDGSDLGTYISN